MNRTLSKWLAGHGSAVRYASRGLLEEVSECPCRHVWPSSCALLGPNLRVVRRRMIKEGFYSAFP